MFWIGLLFGCVLTGFWFWCALKLSGDEDEEIEKLQERLKEEEQLTKDRTKEH